ncbi:MAG: AbrB/MazE/SpoVT family DNA-binding domain-containing protein [Candidatus Woesearchaeota archaeon]
METLTTTRKLGGSLIVTIPKTLAEHAGIGENQMVRITVEKVRKSGFGLCPGLPSFTAKDKFTSQLEKCDML